MKTTRPAGAVLTAAAMTLALAACTPTNEQPTASTPTSAAPQATPADLSGNLQGAGASSQESAMDAWRAGFQAQHSSVTVGYDPVGSGGGIENFLAGAVSFAGTDGLLDADEYALAQQRCGGDMGAIHLPMYVSPVAVIFNIEGIDSLNMAPEVIARIFDGEITRWNDAAIAEANPGVALPDATITVIHRSDSSGTSENFTDYLEQAAGEAWPHEASKEFPETGAQRVGADGTSALVDNVMSTPNSIGYADASRAGSLGTVALLVGDAYVPFTPEAAANIVAASPLSADANGESDLAFVIDRTTTDASAYPLTLVSYHVVCQQYDDPTERDLVTGFLSYVASPEGQQAAASAAGSAPLTPDMSARIQKILDDIAAR